MNKQCVMEKSTVVRLRKGSGVADNLACVEWAHWWVVCSAVQASASHMCECAVLSKVFITIAQ